MNSKVLLVLRIIFGLFLLMFGLNKFFNFLPMDNSSMSEAAMGYMGGLMATKTVPLIGIVEILAGLTLLLNKFAPLMMLILMSVSINAVLFHATLEPGTILGSIILLVLNIVMLYAYKDSYKSLLS